MTKKEFENLLSAAKSLTGEARRTYVDALRGAEVIDENGVTIEPEIIDDSVYPQAKAIASEDEFVKASRQRIFGGLGLGTASAVSHSGRSVFKGANANEKAQRWGAFALALAGNERMKGWLYSSGVVSKAGHFESINAQGGILVPDVLLNDLIDLRLEYGVFRREAKVVNMTSDTATRPRRTSGLTATFVGEGTAGTVSNKTWDAVSLTAKKLMVLSKMSSELNEDAILDIGSDLADEVAYAFSYKEDLCGFNGDGTSTYGGIVGVTTRLTTINGVDDGGGVVLGTGNAWSEFVLRDFHKVIARLPSYAKRNAKWYASPTFIDSVILPLVTAAGGLTGGEMTAGFVSRPFLGYPIVPVEVMPTSEANSQIPILFGDLRQSSDFGDRRVVTIDFATTGTVDGEDMFTTDQIAIRGTERFDINNHSLGTASEAGAVVGLITAAS